MDNILTQSRVIHWRILTQVWEVGRKRGNLILTDKRVDRGDDLILKEFPFPSKTSGKLGEEVVALWWFIFCEVLISSLPISAILQYTYLVSRFFNT